MYEKQTPRPHTSWKISFYILIPDLLQMFDIICERPQKTTQSHERRKLFKDIFSLLFTECFTSDYSIFKEKKSLLLNHEITSSEESQQMLRLDLFLAEMIFLTTRLLIWVECSSQKFSEGWIWTVVDKCPLGAVQCWCRYFKIIRRRSQLILKLILFAFALKTVNKNNDSREKGNNRSIWDEICMLL